MVVNHILNRQVDIHIFRFTFKKTIIVLYDLLISSSLFYACYFTSQIYTYPKMNKSNVN